MSDIVRQAEMPTVELSDEDGVYYLIITQKVNLLFAGWVLRTWKVTLEDAVSSITGVQTASQAE
jgi:hypothetical protein